jgi:hypothetical protein
MPTPDGSSLTRDYHVRAAKSLLWIDCSGGLIVGALVLAFHPWLSTLYALPADFVIAMGAANLAYGGYSFSLVRRAVRPSSLLRLLVVANIAWAVLCVTAAALLVTRASAFGIAALLLEGAYVGGLGLLEWKHLDALLTAT